MKGTSPGPPGTRRRGVGTMTIAPDDVQRDTARFRA
ncbi:hypothetical protein GA0115255_121251, partial [Streptomyces sp. Ncost-T6T-2b]